MGGERVGALLSLSGIGREVGWALIDFFCLRGWALIRINTVHKRRRNFLSLSVNLDMVLRNSSLGDPPAFDKVSDLE